MAKITMKDICKAIEDATVAVKAFEGTRDEIIEQVIIPLQTKLKAGTKAGLRCSERRVKRLFRKLSNALNEFNVSSERPSERAMRLSDKTKYN